jgi:hypothetical protein
MGCPLPSPQAGIAVGRLAHGAIPIARHCAHRGNTDFDPIRSVQAAKESAPPCDPDFPNQPIEYSLFCPENVGYHSSYIHSLRLRAWIPARDHGSWSSLT